MLNKNGKNQKQYNQSGMDSLINEASKAVATDPESLKAAIESGKLENIKKQLSPQNEAALNEILNDKEKLQAVLSSPVARALLKKLQ